MIQKITQNATSKIAADRQELVTESTVATVVCHYDCKIRIRPELIKRNSLKKYNRLKQAILVVYP
jgi:hypothetical protein